MFEDRPELIESQKEVPVEFPKQVEEATTEPVDLEVSLENIRDRWPQIVETVKQKKMSLGSLLSHAVPAELSGNILQLSFKKEENFSAKKVEKNANIVEKAVEEMFTTPLKIKCAIVNSEEKAGSAKTPLEELYQKEPLLRSVVEIFDGELIGSPDN